jgi:hypothetical protein
MRQRPSMRGECLHIGAGGLILPLRFYKKNGRLVLPVEVREEPWPTPDWTCRKARSTS